MEQTAPKILYKDRHIVVAVKPSGWLSEPGEGKSFPTLLSQTLRQQGERDEIFTVHRLDRIVGGVMVFGRSGKAAGALCAQMEKKQLQKEYLAVLRGRPEQDEATLKDLLFRDSSKNKTFVVQRMRRGVRDASLDYRLLSTAQKDGQTLSLVGIRLHTGRTHQIRVQFASRKLPLLGDIRYGSKDPDCEAALWAWRLGFVHPVTGERMVFSHLPPEAYPWTLFSGALPQVKSLTEGR